MTSSTRRNSTEVKVTPIHMDAGEKKMTTTMEEMSGNSLEPRSISLKGGVVMIISLMIGSGIFTSAPEIHQHVRSTGLALFMWLLSGVLALTGALCYAELGTMIPGSGGEAQYLTRGIGPLATYLFDWTSIFILKPGTVAIMLQSFSVYAVELFGYLSGVTIEKKSLMGIVVVKVLACAGCIAVTLLSAYSHRWSNKILDVLTWSKVMALGLIIGGGIVSLIRNHSLFYMNVIDGPFTGIPLPLNEDGSVVVQTTFGFVKCLVLALSAGLWSFEGWNNLNIVAGDLKNPKKNLPLAIWTSVGLVLGLYLMTLLAYYCVIPKGDFIKTETVGLEFGKLFVGDLFGKEWEWVGASVLSLCIMGSTFSAALSSMLTSSEIIVMSAQNGNIPERFGRINQNTKTAYNAYIMQGVLSVILTAVVFDGLLIVYTFPTWIFYALCAFILVLLRYKAPELERPYRVWITTPIIFLISCAVLIVSTICTQFYQSFAGILIILVGVPMFYWYRSSESASESEEPSKIKL